MLETPDHTEILQALTDGVYAVDQQRRITFWNPAATRISGYPAEQVLGRWCGDGLLNHVGEDGESLCGDRCPLLGTMADGQERSARVFLHHADGHLTPIRVTAAPLRDASGAVVGAVETFSDDSALRAAEARPATANRLALQDSLTGLGNRRALQVSMRRRLADWRRNGTEFAVVVADIDQFKPINDEHGHDVGDRVLRTVARSLDAAVRGGDEVFRSGGDEFLVLTGPVTPAELEVLQERLQMVVRLGRYPARALVTVSLGAALSSEVADPATLATLADERLLSAKRARRWE